MSKILIALIVLIAPGCTTAQQSAATMASTDLIGTTSGRITWSAIATGMTRSEVEGVLGRDVVVLLNELNAEVCGDFYSRETISEREVYLSWSSPGPDSKLQIIGVPYSATEQLVQHEEMSAAIRKAHPALQDGIALEGGNSYLPFPTWLVLADSREHALNLKNPQDGMFFLTIAGCAD
jgi:hypothetical protein